MLDKLLEEIKTACKRDAVPDYSKQRYLKIPELDGKYTLRVTPVSTGQGYWSCLAVEILQLGKNPVTEANEYKVGEYWRNYHTVYNTFHPFVKNGKEYALYSKSYTSTRVMSLPDCKDIAGEEANAYGFCPTDFYVPQPNDVVKQDDDEPNVHLDGSFGFVAGCVWGDDSSWKIQYLDLSKIEEGILKRTAKFGYIELEDRCLKDAITGLDYFGEEGRSLTIKTGHRFSLDRDVGIDFSSIVYDEYEKQLRKERPEIFKKCKNCTHPGRYHGKSCPYAKQDGEGKYTGRCNCDNFEPGDETATDDEV